MSFRVLRVSATAALFLAVGLLAGAGPPADQPSSEGPSKGRIPAVVFPVDLNAPDENRPAAEPAGRMPLTPGRTPQTITPGPWYYYRILGIQFQPRNSTSTFAYGGNGCLYQTGGAAAYFVAPVTLPQGASVKYVRFFYNDTSPSDMTLWFTKYEPGQSFTDVTSVTSTGSTGYGEVLSPLINETIDNLTYSYGVVVSPSVMTSAQQFCGVRLAFYWPADGHFTALPPCRVVDTRGGAPLGGGYLPSATERIYTMTGVCGIPASATGVSLNATVTGVTGQGFLSLWQTGTAYPTVSTLNFNPGETQVNAAIVPLNATGQLSVALGVSGGHVILDVNGYYY